MKFIGTVFVGILFLVTLSAPSFAQDSGEPCRNLKNLGDGVYRCGDWVCQMKDGVSFPEEMKDKDWKTSVDFMQQHPELMQMMLPPTEGKLEAIPSDPDFSRQAGLNGQRDSDIGVLDVWTIGTGNKDVTVCVIDSGVDRSHSDLVDNVDDRGANFISNPPSSDFNDPDIAAEGAIEGHGTCMSGVIGAKGNNGVGISGVVQDIRLLPLRVVDATTGNVQSGAVIEAVDDCISKKGNIINASFVFRNPSDALRAGMKLAFQRAIDNGITVLAAAGNQGVNIDEAPVMPASLDPELSGLICVASIDSDGRLSSFSNFGTTCGVAAPGAGVLSTKKGGGFESCGGTSSACAMMSGSAALMKSIKSDLTPAQIEQAIVSNVTPRSELSGKVSSGGSLNVRNAISSLGIALTTTTPEAQKEVASSGGSSGGCNLLSKRLSKN